MSEPTKAPRYVPEEPLPSYSYVPRQFPHPTRDPGGHGLRFRAEHTLAPPPERWNVCRPYLYGIDLFNYGYYWEAHEVWESLWHACGRTGLTADFLRALIRLAAAGVKVREGRSAGVASHASAAGKLFQQIAAQLGGDHKRYMGLSLHELCAFSVAAAKVGKEVEPGTRVAVVFPFFLLPS